jgi:hypothetical protein
MNIIEIYETQRFILPDIYWYTQCELILGSQNPIILNNEISNQYIYQFRNKVYNKICRNCFVNINTKEHKVIKNPICLKCSNLDEFKYIDMNTAKLKYDITDKDLATLYCGLTLRVYISNTETLIYNFLEKDIINLLNNKKIKCELSIKKKICINLINMSNVSNLILKVYATNTDLISTYCSNIDIISWNIAHHEFIKLNKNKYGNLIIIRNNLINKINTILVNTVLKIYDKSEIRYRIQMYPYSYYNYNNVITDLIYKYYNMKLFERKKLLFEFFSKNKILYKKQNALCSNYINGYCCKSIEEVAAITKLSNILFLIGYRYWLQNKLQYENILKDRVLNTGVKWMDAVDTLIEEKIYLSRLYLG